MVQNPQYTFDQLYISPFTKRRTGIDEHANYVYEPIVRNLHPSGINILDEMVNAMTSGTFHRISFCKRHGMKSGELNTLIRLMTGMDYEAFHLEYMKRLADDYLRYTDLGYPEIAEKSGMGTHVNFCKICQKAYQTSPSWRRFNIREKGDLDRFKL